MKNLTLENITTACHGTYHGDETSFKKEVAGVVIDSRKVEKDYLFVAIDGGNVNAHKFIPDTIEKGALCVVSHEDLGETDFPYILVESTGQALLDIAKLYRDSFDIKVVGITGSVGKTSTKEMIASVLSQKYNVHKTLGNFNNEWGLPITIFEMNETHEVAILEMGVNHFGEMRRLSSVASPDICVITNIGMAHLEFFKTREGILQEKSQMIQDMKTGGSILLNGDDDLLRDMGPVKGVDPEFFGLGKNCQFYATDVESLGLRGSSCTIHLPSGESFDCIVPLPGAHMVQNALAGTAVGYQLGLTPAEIKAGIEGLPSIPGRNNIIQTDKIRYISGNDLRTDDITDGRADGHVYFYALMAFLKKFYHLIPVSISVSTLENGNVQFLFFCFRKCCERGKYSSCAHGKNHCGCCKSFFHMVFPPSGWLFYYVCLMMLLYCKNLLS